MDFEQLNDVLKTFLKINSPKVEDKSYYQINKARNALTLYDPINKEPSDKSSYFEENKIFIETDENSYIYEEICRDTIKESFNGISYSFISYGESNSDKLKLLISDIKDNELNYNNRGIFPRLIDNLIKKQKNLNEKLKLEISYFLVHDNDLIDLSNLKNEKNNINEEKLYKDKYTIKNEENFVDKIKKVNIEESEKELKFLNKIINILISFEEKNEDNNKNIFTRSHICIIIYVLNEINQKKSLINFLILNGSEYLYSGRSEKYKDLFSEINNKSNKNIIEGTKIALETQYTYETLVNLIKLKIDIDNNIDSLNENQIKLILDKNKLNSKLTIIQQKILFATSKMKFRIIGTISPNIGFYQNFKDTLIFLFEFQKIIKSLKNNKSSSKDIDIFSNRDDNLKNYDKLKTKRYSIQTYESTKKDNMIFELEKKINKYKKSIDEYKEKLAKKEQKITFLQQTYKEQIKTIKKKFNFTGDINILISGDENTKEAEFVKNLKDAAEIKIRNEGNIHLLQKKLDNAEEEIKRLKNKVQLYNDNDTMIKYYLSKQQNNEDKKKDNKKKNELFTKIEELKNEIKTKNKLIENYKKEIENKNKIIFNLPKCLKETYTNSISNENKKENENLNENYNDNDSTNSINIYNNEIKQIKLNNEKNMNILKLKYENIIKEKNNEIQKLEYNYEGFKLEKDKDINKYANETIKINKILMSLISNYKRIFDSNLTKKCSIINLNNKKEEFDKIIMTADKDINYNNFPLLYQTLIKTNQLKINQPLIHSNLKKIYSPISIKKEEDLKEEKLNIKGNDLKSEIPINEEKINKFIKEETNNGKIIFSKETLQEMSKESLINHCINLNNKIIEIENFLKKYTEYKRGFNVEKFEQNEKYKDGIINDLKNKVSKLAINLDEQIKINNNNILVINSQNRKIDKLEKDTILYNNLLKYKKKSSLILSPNKSNSSAIDFKSINTNNTLNKNNINFSLKKSMSDVSLQPFIKKVNKLTRNKSNNTLSRHLSPKINDLRSNIEKNRLFSANSVK